MKKLILFLLLPLWAMAQTSTGQEQEFDYGIKNNSTQTITTPPYLTTTGIDGTQGKIPSALIEKTDNKQNSLAVDGTGTKYPTVDAVNAGLGTKQNVLTNPVTGTGTTNYVPKFTGSGALGNSLIYDDGTNIGIGITSPLYPFDLRASFTAGVSPPYLMHLKPTYTVPSTGSYEQSTLKLRPNMTIPAGVTQSGLYIGVYSSILRENALDAGNLAYMHSTASIYGHLPGVTGRTEQANGVTVHPYHMGGSIGESRALFLENAFTGITPDKYFGIYQEDILAKNYFNANANLFGTLTDNGSGALVQVNGSISATSYTGGATLTGTPTAPTAPVGTNTMQVANMAALQAAVTSNIAQTITNGVTTSSPSQDAVFDALALKANLSGATFSGTVSTSATVNGSGGFTSGGNYLLGTSFTGLTSPSNGNISFLCSNNVTPGWVSNTSITATFYKTTVYTVSTLPTTGVASGTYATVSDATAPTYLGALTGGGSVVCPVFYNGVNWVAH